MALTTTALNQMVNTLGVNTIKLHSGDPGAAGTANEISGATGIVSFDTATNGVRSLASPVDINVPAGTVSHYSLWAGSTLVATGAFSTPETFASPGIARIDTGTLTITSP